MVVIVPKSAFGPGPAGAGGHLALELLQDVLCEESPLHLQLILEVADAAGLAASCLPAELV